LKRVAVNPLVVRTTLFLLIEGVDGASASPLTLDTSLITLYQSIAEAHPARRAFGQLIGVSNHDEGLPLLVELIKKIENFGTGARIKISGGLVSENN
jgi:hypothetical protein